MNWKFWKRKDIRTRIAELVAEYTLQHGRPPQSVDVGYREWAELRDILIAMEKPHKFIDLRVNRVWVDKHLSVG